MFNTDVRVLNAVANLATKDFDQVAACLANCGHPVDTLGVVSGRLYLRTTPSRQA